MVEAMRPFLKKSSTFQTTKPRIVFVNSIFHRTSPHGTVPLSLAQINDPVHYNRVQWYGMSKLENLLFTKAFSRRLQKDSRYSHILVNSMHPGGMYTNFPRQVLGNGIAKIFQPILNLGYWAVKPMLWSADRAALTSLYLATSPEVERFNYRGEYFIPIAKMGNAMAVVNDGELQDRVWEFTEQLWQQPPSQSK
jgi:NAD(P)-dependent dehydrogenase (short-subunit alcohol dehydrogenase family)